MVSVGTVASSEGVGSVLRPRSWGEALELRATRPDLKPICGGTDLMVEINFGRVRPGGLLDLSGVSELNGWEYLDAGHTIRLGAGVSYSRIIAELRASCPALASAARTVGSPQIRNRGTVGGNLGTASPAGDAHPPLLACRARIETASVRGERMIEIDDFFLAPKRSALEADELIRAVHMPVATGPQQFAKVGPRNAMVIATTSFALSLDTDAQRVGTGIGSAGPTPLRAPEAERVLEEAFSDSWSSPGVPRRDVLVAFGGLVAAAASPIDDVRGTADYRRHALGVMASRCAGWAWSELDDRVRS